MGLFLFKIQNWDKISTTSAKFQSETTDYAKFKKVVSLENSLFFKGHGVAFENLQRLKNGELTTEITNFIKSSFPKIKNSGVQLVFYDKVLASKVKENLGISTLSGESYNEIFRGIRTNISKFISNIGDNTINTNGTCIKSANLGIGHAFARNNIQFDEKRQDKAIINSFTLLELMDKNLNTFVMRLKET